MNSIIFDIYNENNYGYIIEKDGQISKYDLYINNNDSIKLQLKLKQSKPIKRVDPEIINQLIEKGNDYIYASYFKNEEEIIESDKFINYIYFNRLSKVNIKDKYLIKLLNILIEENTYSLICINCKKDNATMLELQSLNLFCSMKCQNIYLNNINDNNIIKEPNVDKQEEKVMMLRNENGRIRKKKILQNNSNFILPDFISSL